MRLINEQQLTCSELHKGKLPLIVDVHVDDTRTCSATSSSEKLPAVPSKEAQAGSRATLCTAGQTVLARQAERQARKGSVQCNAQKKPLKGRPQGTKSQASNHSHSDKANERSSQQ